MEDAPAIPPWVAQLYVFYGGKRVLCLIRQGTNHHECIKIMLTLLRYSVDK